MDQPTRSSTTGFAPYDGPEVAPVDARPPRVFYGIDSRRVTLREYSSGSWWHVLPAALLKLLRVKVPSATDDPNVESLAAFEVAAGDVPGVIVQRLSLALQRLKSLGFHSPIWHVIEDDVHQVKTYLATLRSDTGRVWARVHYRVWSVQTPPKTKQFCELVSEVGGEYLWSLSGRPDLAAPSSCTVLRDVDATPTGLLATHLSELRLLGNERAKMVDSPEALRDAVERHHTVVRDFHRARGVFVPLTAAEQETADAFRSSVTTAQEIGSRYPEILAEVHRLQNRKASRVGGLLLLLASAALFVGAGLTNAGGSRFSPRLLAIIVGVLFFHELGHWVAMRTFGYRNLKMFFIPFFGAAVSGRHYNVPGWKKVVVSLMGPMPGILLGAGLGVLGVRMHNHLLVEISLAALLLNGFNLLPILPLDGGWVVQAILFSRHHLLELAFRVTTLLALIGIGALTNDQVLRYVAIGMAVSLPAMYRISRITNALRRERLAVASTDGQTLPHAAADVIVDRVKAAFSAKLSNRMAAQYTLQIFENLNARPPGILASLAFAIVQFGTIAGAAVAVTLLFVLGMTPATAALDQSTISVARTLSDSALAKPRNVVVASFDKGEKIPPALAALGRVASPQMAVERLGTTVLVSIPFEDVDGARQVQTQLESPESKVFVATEEEPARMRLSCTTASAGGAAAIERELEPYLAGAGLDLVPPWKSDATWSADEKARYANARSTYLALWRAAAQPSPDAEVKALLGRMLTARRDGNAAEVARLSEEYTALVARLRSDRIAAVRAGSGADTLLVDAFAVAQAEADTASVADSTGLAARRVAALGPMLGQLPMVDGHATPESAQWSASGLMTVRDSAVSMPIVRFTNVFQGAPAMARWLLGKGCGGMKYGFVGGGPRTTAARE